MELFNRYEKEVRGGLRGRLERDATVRLCLGLCHAIQYRTDENIINILHNGRLLRPCQRDNGNYAPRRTHYAARSTTSGLRQPSGGIMQPEGGIMFPEGLHDFHWPEGRAQ